MTAPGRDACSRDRAQSNGARARRGSVGLPINSLYSFGLLVLGALVLSTGTVRTAPGDGSERERSRCLRSDSLLLPAPRIEEGHNIVLIDGPDNALQRGLPPAVYRVMAERFDAAYPADRRCASGTAYCWRPNGVPKRTFAFAADGIFDGHRYSRRVPASVPERRVAASRLINDLSLDILKGASDVGAFNAIAARLRCSDAGKSGCRFS